VAVLCRLAILPQFQRLVGQEDFSTTRRAASAQADSACDLQFRLMRLRMQLRRG
jgi:hypothetical protein